MHKIKFNTRTLDKASGQVYEPSSEFVEVSEAFALRIKELMEDPRHKGSWEFYEKADMLLDGKQIADVIEKSSKPRKKKDD